MLRIPFLFALALVTIQAQAKPCKRLVVDTTDAFGARVHGGIVYVDRGHYLAVGIREEEGQLVVSTMWVHRGVVETVVPAGTEVQFALEGGTTFSGSTLHVAEPVSNVNGSAIFTQWQMTVAISDDTLSLLSTTPLIAVKSKWGGDAVTFPIPAKKQADMMTIAQCMLPGE